MQAALAIIVHRQRVAATFSAVVRLSGSRRSKTEHGNCGNPQIGAGYAHATTCGVNKNNRPASSIVISPFEQRLRAAAQCFCCNHKAARLAFECLHLTSIGARPCSHKLHSLAAARASDVLAVMHWNMSPSRSSQGGPLGPETSPSAGTLGNNRAN